jgi:ubiquinone/menaquinone biosynthesis C-methylase UbiE
MDIFPMEPEKNIMPAEGPLGPQPSSINVDSKTISGFGDEWQAFDQSKLQDKERQSAFDQYFSMFPWDKLPTQAVGADIGCGSGRWSGLVSMRVAELLVCDPSDQALAVAKKNLGEYKNIKFAMADAGNLPVADQSLDFAFSLGVLHHVPDTALALKAIAAKLKPGAPFLVYLYYAFDGAPWWFRALWRCSDGLRRGIARLPFFLRRRVTDTLAFLVYLPLARMASVLEKTTGRVSALWPLAYYRDKSFYAMRTDALDRFGTRLEQRFSQEQIQNMLDTAGFRDVQFSPRQPFWTALAYRRE